LTSWQQLSLSFGLAVPPMAALNGTDDFMILAEGHSDIYINDSHIIAQLALDEIAVDL
jgi:hypothetical protein